MPSAHTHGNPPVIALLLPGPEFFAHPGLQPLLATAGECIQEHGCDLILSTHNDNPTHLNTLLSSIDGLIVPHAPAPETLAAAQLHRVPYAIVETPNALEPAITGLIAALSETIAEKSRGLTA